MNKSKKKEIEKEAIKDTYTCPICGKEHKDERYCPVVIKKMARIKPENQSTIMGGVLLECLERDVDFIQIIKEIVYFVGNGTKSDNQKFLDIDLFVSYFAAALGCSPIKFSKKMKEFPRRFNDILNYADVQNIDLSVDENNMIDSIEVYLEGDDGPFWEMVYKHDQHGHGLSNITVYIRKETSDRKPTYQIRLLYWFNDKCFHKRNMYHGTYSCVLYAEREGRLKEYFEEHCDWTSIAQKIPCTFLEASRWAKKLKEATQNGLLRWFKADGEDSILYSTTYGQSEIQVLITKEMSFDEKRWAIRYGKFVDSIYIRENDRKMYHYGTTNEHYEIGGSDDDEIIKDPMIRSLGATIERWNKEWERNDFKTHYRKRVVKKSDVLSVTYSFMCSQNEHIVTPYCGVVTILTPEGKLTEENVYLGRCNACDVYYIFRRDYNELCKKGQPMCKVIDASSGKTLSDSSFAFNSSSILSEMGYNVQAAVNMTASERQEILRIAIEEKKVSVNEVLNLLELQIRLHLDRGNYRNAVDKWKEDAEFVKSYGINSGRIKLMTNTEQED